MSKSARANTKNQLQRNIVTKNKRKNKDDNIPKSEALKRHDRRTLTHRFVSFDKII